MEKKLLLKQNVSNNITMKSGMDLKSKIRLKFQVQWIYNIFNKIYLDNIMIVLINYASNLRFVLS